MRVGNCLFCSLDCSVLLTAVALSPLVRRIIAPNPGRMTGSGTNTYLVGSEKIAVIDPGPAIDHHIDTILAECGDRLAWVLVTHTHPDHSPAAKILAASTGATLLGCVMSDDGHQDTSFQVESNINHGECLQTDEFTLEAIHTPGHVANHFCYLLQQEALLFSGDHIMQGSSVVIIPPAGNMADYIASTKALGEYQIAAIAPGHGEVMNHPKKVMGGIVRHRLLRESWVVKALAKQGASSLEELVPEVYSDVDPALWKLAKYSLWAHLLKLEQDGRVEKQIFEHWAFGEERWQLLPDVSK